MTDMPLPVPAAAPPRNRTLRRFLRHRLGVTQASARQNHREFLAAIARRANLTRGDGAQGARDIADHLVANRMAPSIVDLLEMIDVAKNQAERFSAF